MIAVKITTEGHYDRLARYFWPTFSRLRKIIGDDRATDEARAAAERMAKLEDEGKRNA